MIKKRAENSKLIEEKKLEELKQLQKPKVTNQSELLFQRRLSDKLGKIFELLDHLDKGRVTADDISLENVPIEIILILKPLLLEIEEFKESLDKEEFTESAASLL